QHLEESGGVLTITDTVAVLSDIAATLVDLDGRVVHRDVKPENVLFLGDRWCLADFGISRYAEATTSPDTQKFALSPPYAAPERWRGERATAAADIYAVGAIAFEMATGSPVFSGPNFEDYREQHLHSAPSGLENIPAGLSSLIASCLYKPAQARPSPETVAARITGLSESASPSSGLASLER